MGTETPEAFAQAFSGPEGSYIVRFDPAGASDGVLETVVGGHVMRWPVEVVRTDEDGLTVISGMTRGSEPLWGDQYWFELRPWDQPAVIRYWGDQVLIREDTGA